MGKILCPTCGTEKEVAQEVDGGDRTIYMLSCGHKLITQIFVDRIQLRDSLRGKIRNSIGKIMAKFVSEFRKQADSRKFPLGADYTMLVDKRGKDGKYVQKVINKATGIVEHEENTTLLKHNQLKK